MPPASSPGGERPQYREYAPSADLAQVVRCFWHITASNAVSTINRICPDGSADIVMATDGSIRAIGTMRTAVIMPVAGRVDTFGVRFQPGEAFPFLDLPLGELTDAAADMRELGWKRAVTLAERIAETDSIAARLAVVESLLRRRRVATARRPTPPAIRAAIGLLERSPGRPGLGAVRELTGATERTLERQFHELVGLSPKAFERVARFRRAQRRIQRRPRASFAAIAFEAGYADQPHFIREFRALAGITPAAYAREWDAVGFVQSNDLLSA